MHVFSKNGGRTFNKFTLSKLSKTSDVMNAVYFTGFLVQVWMCRARHTYCGGESTLLDCRSNGCIFTAMDLEIELYRHFRSGPPLCFSNLRLAEYRIYEFSGTVVRHVGSNLS
jgi:hypothetical protein